MPFAVEDRVRRWHPHSHPISISDTPITNDAVLARRVRVSAVLFLTVAGIVECIFSRFALNPDGIAYIDMGEAIFRADWHMAVNAYWSPLYPALLGLVLRVVQPPKYLEFPFVHLVNLLIYFFALASFDFLLRATVARQSRTGGHRGAVSRIPDWAVFAIGYAVFFWSSLHLINLAQVTPDLLVAGFIYLAVGVLLRIWMQPERISLFVFLGAVLGFGYLAKAFVFPLAFLFFAVALVLAGGWRQAAPRVLLAVVTFLALSGPWFVALSHAKGRFTIGDSGRLNYVMFVNGASPAWYLQSVGTAVGHYTHPVRQIFNAPPIYEFSTPIRGTIPVGDDPSYWAEGVSPRFLLKRQAAVLFRWASVYFDLLFTSLAGLLAGFMVLALMAGRGLFLKQATALWPVWLVGLAGLAMYALVFVEMRYVACFLTLLWVGFFAALRISPGRNGRRLAAIVTIGVVIAVAGPMAKTVLMHLVATSRGQTQTLWTVAQDLKSLGVKPGDKVARIGYQPSTMGWTRLLGVVVVADIPPANARDFWLASPEVRSQAIAALRRLGVAAIVAEILPTDAAFVPGPEWHRLGGGTFYALTLPPGPEK